MDIHLSRRRLVQLCSGTVPVMLSGCQQDISGEDTSGEDVIIENSSLRKHQVHIHFDREGYWLEDATVEVASGEKKEIGNFVPVSDTQYHFTLVFFVDGEHTATSSHKWRPDKDYVATVHHRGKITVSPGKVIPADSKTPTTY